MQTKEQQIIEILSGMCINEANATLQAVAQCLQAQAIVTPLPPSSEESPA